MKDRIKKYWFPLCAFGLSLISALFWVALRINHSGISKFLGADTNPSFLVMNLPVMVTVLAWIGFGFALLGLKVWNRKKWPAITGFVTGAVMAVAAVFVIIFGAKEYLRFILPHFWESLVVSGCIIGFALILLFPPMWKNRLKYALIAAVVAVAVGIGYELRPCTLSYEPVVYAVEDEYQIVFTTSDNAIAWVNIGGKEYHDLYAGSMKSADKVHKITVPQEALDEACGYSVNYRQMIYRGPFGGFKGKEISSEYTFRPVNTADGLVYYTMTDVHHARTGAVKAALAVENLDFLVILGDSVGMVEYEKDAQYSNLLAHDVTGGQIPVVYARGNHEIKGTYAEELYKYVGSKNERFYYWFTLSDVFGITLDLGEDHNDGWWEYYGTDRFTLYHNEQTQFLQELAETKPYEGYNYTLVACHIPIQFVNSRKDHVEVKAEWTELLNRIQPDLAVYGHQHDLYPFLNDQETMYNEKGKLVYNSQFKGEEGKTYGGYLTDYTFNGFIAGRRGTSQVDDIGSLNRKEHVGMAVSVDLTSQTQTCRFINTAGEVVSVYNPFAEGPAQKEYLLDLP